MKTILKNGLRVLGYCIGLVVLIEVVMLLFFSHHSQGSTISFTSPDDYTDLFNDSAKHKMILYVTNVIKGKNPISEYTYDERYSVVVYKMNISPAPSLKSLITQNKKLLDLGFWGSSYDEFQVEQLDFNVNFGSITPADKINISFQADSARNIFRSDTVSSSGFLLNKMEIQYNDKTHAELMITKRRSFSKNIPMVLTLVKKEKFLYFVFLSPVFKNDLDLNDLPKAILNKNLF